MDVSVYLWRSILVSFRLIRTTVLQNDTNKTLEEVSTDDVARSMKLKKEKTNLKDEIAEKELGQ